MTQTRYATCTLCEASCGIRVEVDDDTVTSIRGSAGDPLSHGHLCPKAVALQDLRDDPDRLRYPVRKTGNDWRTISWGAAFDEVVARLADVQRRHGRHSVATYLGNANVHNLGFLTHGLPFVRMLRTHNSYSATSVDQLPHQLVSYYLYGHQFLLPVPDVDRTSYFLVFGANPLVSNGSTMTAPGMGDRLRRLQERGGRLVVFDPRRTETARTADEHHFVRPGTDAFVLLALLRTVLTDGLATPPQYVHGLDTVRAAVDPFTPERVAAVTGVAAADMRRSNNSWMHNSPRLTKGKPRHLMFMHPDDLAARGLADGDRVRVRSRVGVIELETTASTEMMPGVVSIPHGYGQSADGTRQQVAAGIGGASVNNLTDPADVDAVSGTASLSGVPVQVEPAPGDAQRTQ